MTNNNIREVEPRAFLVGAQRIEAAEAESRRTDPRTLFLQLAAAGLRSDIIVPLSLRADAGSAGASRLMNAVLVSMDVGDSATAPKAGRQDLGPTTPSPIRQANAAPRHEGPK